MDVASPAGRAFAEALGVPVTPALEAAIEAAIAKAHARFPAIALDPAELARYVAARLDGPDLAGACVEDLHLAAGCLRGDEAALAAFEGLLAQTPAWVRRPASASIVDELKQRLRASLLVGPDAQLASYKGRGALHAWLRVSATRMLWKMEAGEGRERRLSDGPAEDQQDAAARARRVDPERALAGERAEPAVTEAIRVAFASLTQKQRALLRLRHGGGLTDEKIGQMYGVHQSTATRWIAAAHEAVASAMRKHLEEQWKLGVDEVESVLGVARSRIDVSLSALLRSEVDPK